MPSGPVMSSACAQCSASRVVARVADASGLVTHGSRVPGGQLVLLGLEVVIHAGAAVRVGHRLSFLCRWALRRRKDTFVQYHRRPV